MDRIHKALGDKKKVDIYEVARVDPTMTIEEIMHNLVILKDEGHFSVSYRRSFRMRKERI